TLFAELRPQGTREFVAAVDLIRERRDLGAREAAHFAADLVERIAETEVEIPALRGRHGLPVPQFGSYDCRTIGRETQARCFINCSSPIAARSPAGLHAPHGASA